MPSWVPLVKYTPRSSTWPVELARVEDVGHELVSASRIVAICCGKAKTLARRRVSRTSSTRSKTRSLSRVIQRVELRGERLRRLVRERLLVGEGHAPDLRPAFRREVVEVLGEPVDQVALGDHQVDGQLDPQLAVQLLEPAARRLDVRLARRRRSATIRSWALIVRMTPLIGRRARYFRSSARNSLHPALSDAASESCVV